MAAFPPPEEAIADDAEAAAPARDKACWVTAVDPKPLSENVRRGLKWLVEQQHPNGGWSQGEESRQMGGAGPSAKPNVGDTCAAALALIRSGSTPSQGPYADAIGKALGFIMPPR